MSLPFPRLSRAALTLQDGLYKALALALYPDLFWPVSVALVAKGLGGVEAGRSDRKAFSTTLARRDADPATAMNRASMPAPLPGPELSQRAKMPAEIQAAAVSKAESRRLRKQSLKAADSNRSLHGTKDRPGRSTERGSAARGPRRPGSGAAAVPADGAVRV